MAKHNTIMSSVHTNGTLPSKTCAEFDTTQDETLKHFFKHW